MANSRRSSSLAHSSNEEFVGSQRRDQFENLERIRDRDVAHTPSQRTPSIHTNHISQSYTRPTSHHSHDEEVHNLRREMDYLCRRLNCKVWISEERTVTPN